MGTQDADKPAADKQNTAEQAWVKLQSPIQRGETTITELQLNKPKAGALRGIKLAELLTLQVDAIIQLLPRISTPNLVAHEINNMDPVDIVACAMEVVNFLTPAEALEKAKQNQSADYLSE